MFKIVENEDGSTGVYSSDSGLLICNVLGKKNITMGSGHTVPRENAIRAPAIKPNLSPSQGVKKFSLKKAPKQKEVCNNSSKGQKILTEIHLGSSSTEYNLRHSATKEEEKSIDFLSLNACDEECDDIANDCISQDDLLQCLNLVSLKKLREKPISELKQSFPRRTISRTAPIDLSGSIGVEALDCLGICSSLGKHILNSFPRFTVSEQSCVERAKKYNRFCSTLHSGCDVDGYKAPQLRCRDLLRKYPVVYKPQKNIGKFVHLYSFTKRQRTERNKVLCSGLSKRSRQLKHLCKKLTVSVKRLSDQEIKGIVEEMKKSSLINCTVSNVENNPLNSTEVSRVINVASVKPYWSSQSSGGVMDKNIHEIPAALVTASPKDANGKQSNIILLPQCARYSLPKALQVTSNGSPAQQCPLKKNNGEFIKLNPGTYKISSQTLNHNNESKEVPFSEILCFNANEKTLTKGTSGEAVMCLVPLQDVVKKIFKVGDKCYIKGTSIKACGIEDQRENLSCVNNVSSVGNQNLSHDHAYHRSPTISPVKPINRESDIDKVGASIKAVYSNQSHVLSENCPQYRLSNGSVISNKEKYKASHTNVVESSLKSPDQRLSQPLSSHVLNNAGNILKCVKPKSAPFNYLKTKCNKQTGKYIPLIDIADDSSDESHSPKNISVKWVFTCYGCGYQRTLKSQEEEFNEMVLKHMRVFHSVNDPGSFLSTYFKSSERAVVTEAFPGYKNKE